MSVKQHSLNKAGVVARWYKAIGDTQTGIEEFMPINVVVGRNNAGKSTLIDLIDIAIKAENNTASLTYLPTRSGKKCQLSTITTLDETEFNKLFVHNAPLVNSNHDTYKEMTQIGKNKLFKTIDIATGTNEISHNVPYKDGYQPEGYISNNKKAIFKHKFKDKQLIRILADRDVKPEPESNRHIESPAQAVQSNGDGLTNLVRAFLVEDNLERRQVEEELLRDLNKVYRGDNIFQRIICRENRKNDDRPWEIFLVEESKGDIRLSDSGSSLRTVFIILAMLRLRPVISKITWDLAILAVEEPENNLHPSLLRRLLSFLAHKRDEMGFTLIFTTHSSTTIDWAARREDSQIVHVRHDGAEATASRTISKKSHGEILDDLEYRASDLLQSNGIIWVEGPSDRIYINHWLNLVSDGKLSERSHYSIMFYGGRLLNHLDALTEEETKSRISLMSINRNMAVVMDSDRTSKRRKIGKTKQRILSELNSVDGFEWVTEGREIENYLPMKLLAKITGEEEIEEDIYERRFNGGFLDKFKDKVEFAHKISENSNTADFKGHLDLWEKLEQLRDKIHEWNGLKQS